MTQETRVFRPSALAKTQHAVLISRLAASCRGDQLELARDMRQLSATAEAQSDHPDIAQQLMLAVAASILADLAEQGWRVESAGKAILITPPYLRASSRESVLQVKSRIRNSLMVSSDRQLAGTATQDFLKFMERTRSFDGKVVSVRSLVDDGASLAQRLSDIGTLGETEKSEKLRTLIRPVVQVCDPEARCEFTGYKLLDIWRYFRHTWALEYNSVPGRTIRFLIRNRARPSWPIIGIAMLSSPAANLYVRDAWIGWRTDDLIENILSGQWDAADVAKKLLNVVRQSIADIRTDDLATEDEIECGGQALLFRLRQAAARAKADRAIDLSRSENDGREAAQLIDIRCLGSDPKHFEDADWFKLSDTALYRMKRAEQLVELVATLSFLKSAGIETAPAASLYEILITKRGKTAITFVLNEIRKRALASDVADLSVCGAIPPYNHLLGGKLVALLMASCEVRDTYHARYADKPSEIASQLAGRKIVRSSDLKVLTTTSLYGIGSSQYNRLRLRAGIVPKLFHDLTWDELEMTQGYSVTHFSKKTASLMRRLGTVVHGRRRINSVFGEGSSPRTRPIRQGFLSLGIGDSNLLKQPTGRRVYACEVYPGARADLVGFERNSRKGKPARLAAISQAWIHRWVLGRISQPAVIDRISDESGESVSQSLRIRSLRGMADLQSDTTEDLETGQSSFELFG